MVYVYGVESKEEEMHLYILILCGNVMLGFGCPLNDDNDVLYFSLSVTL